MTEGQKSDARELGLKIKRELMQQFGENLDLHNLERAIQCDLMSAVNKELVRLKIHLLNGFTLPQNHQRV